MDNQRLFLFLALSLVVMLLFSSWQEQFGTSRPATTPGVVSETVPSAPQDLPAGTPETSSEIPAPVASAAPVPGDKTSPVAAADAMAGSSAGGIAKHQRVRVITDVLDIELDSTGADIRKVALLNYPEQASTPDIPVQLFDDELPRLLVAQSGLLGNKSTSVDHHVIFTSEKTDYRLDESKNDIVVRFNWQDDKGLAVTKTYTFHRNSYVIDMDVELTNGTGQEWSGRFYRQMKRTQVDEKNQSSFIYTFMGGVVSNESNPYEKISFDEMSEWKPEQSFTKSSWVAMAQHYFLGAWVPPADELTNVYTRVVDGNQYILGMQTGENRVAAGQTGQFASQLYIGPKIQKELEKVSPNLKLTVDFGILTILADPLFWLMDWIYGWVQNWGWAIIFVTLIVKLVFYKLSEAAYKSMANMRKFQPKLQQLKERYGSDRQRMSQAMMEIYKKEKINPLGGCLPMLVQIPVFISLYWVLLESVELRQADFMLWITDLSSKDPYYVLPLLMGASMLIQQRLNPAPMDPVQKKVMQVLPIVFTLFFAFFPAGLVLYWVVNNVLSILQQWYITRKIEAQTDTKK